MLADFQSRGLLDDTLVLWGGEFGRTPYALGGGRDHNNKGYTMWMAGGGVKGGFTYGRTDDHGFEAVEDKMHVHDGHATILHLLGLDHERLTFRYAGRDMRLTDVKGNAAAKILTQRTRRRRSYANRYIEIGDNSCATSCIFPFPHIWQWMIHRCRPGFYLSGQGFIAGYGAFFIVS